MYDIIKLVILKGNNMAVNVTKVYLLNVPMEDDLKNTLYFASASAQQSYFSSVIGKTYTNVSYQSETRTFRCPDQIDTVRQYNYLMWQNTHYSNKWFYAFIKKMVYVSDGYTDVQFEVDPLQTYMFDITVKPSFVEREHTNNDAVGANTYPESFELGEMVCNGSTINFGGANPDNVNLRYYCVIEVSQVENKGTSSTLSFSWVDGGTHDTTPMINNIERGTIPLIIGGTFAGHSSGQIRSPSDVTYIYDKAGLGDSIVNMYLLPQELIPGFREINLTVSGTGIVTTTLDGIGIPVETFGTDSMATVTFTRPNTVNGYTPKNNKMLCYPMNYFIISNNAGVSQPFRYEDFNSGVTFNVEGTFGVSGSTKAIPQHYKNIGTGNALDYSINGPKFPVCSWKSDSYTNWLTQNAVNMGMDWNKELIGSVVDIGVGATRGALAGGPIGAAVGAGVGVATAGMSLIGLAQEQFKSKTSANMVSDQVKGNLNAGDFLWAKYRSPFTFIPMSIKSEYARIIDDFWQAFGYQVNRLKVPNTNHRQNWWYTKTIDANIIGNVPNDEMNKIKGAYNNGLTFWRTPANFLNYSLSNGIV